MKRHPVEQTPYLESNPFEAARYADNPDPRCPCVLVLDRSGSMAGRPIDELNAGLQQFRSELLGDQLAARRVEIAVVPFGPLLRGSPFHAASQFQPQALTAGGDTPTGAAVEYAIELIATQKASYKHHGIPYYRPWIILITDGQPTDDWSQAARLVHDGESAKAFSFFAIGVSGADMNVLRKLSVREPLKLQGLAFREFFLWLSASLTNVSKSAVGEQVALPPPSGWASV
jgi:uncharacterized protein YegL